MKTKLRYSATLFLSSILLFFAQAQDRKLNKADEQYENYGYVDAREVYLKVAEKGYESEELYQKLANSYYFNANYTEALSWYEKLFSLEENPSPEYFLRYAQSLKANGKVKKAKKYYDLFREQSGQELESKAMTAEDYLRLIETNSERYTVKKLNKVNSEGIEFGHSKNDEKLVYASTQDTGVFMKRKSGWDGLSFLDLYEVSVEGDSVTGKPKKLKGEVNDKYHESSAVFTRDGETMYFTRSNTSPENKEKNQKLKIYRAQLIDGKWQEIEDLSINSDDYSTAHPALDSAETRLYFSSDRPGGYGASDLYMASIGEEGNLGKAENLGSEINTEGKETFPFISKKNELYFSSDGHFGLGGLDVFYVQIEAFGFGNLLNVGKPVNSYADDFSFGIEEDKEGFFSSNRVEGAETSFVHDNIYYLKEEEEIIDVYEAKIFGTVTDKDTGEPIADATITLFEADDSEYATIKTDENGYYEITVNYYDSYRVRAEKEDYDSAEKLSEAEQEEQEINFELKRNKLELTPGADIGPLLSINDILFDFDKSNIRPDAQVELEKLLTVMEEYSDLKIDIRSHTDSRGSDRYNEALSDRRAKSTLAYLVDHGIAKERLSAKGYGETQLVNDCKNGVPCSKEQHQANRRSEFIVLE